MAKFTTEVAMATKKDKPEKPKGLTRHVIKLENGKTLDYFAPSIKALRERDRLNQFQTGRFRD